MSNVVTSLFLSSTPNGSQNPETALYRLSHSYQTQTANFTSTQALVDQGVTHFIDGVFDAKTGIALLGGGMANSVGRLGVMTLGQRLGSGALVSSLVRGTSHLAGIAVESAVFAGVNHGFDNPRFGKNWAHAAATLGPLKLIPGLFPNQNIVLRHLTTDLGMVGGEHLAYALNVGEKPEGDLTTQLAHAEAVNWQMKGTLSLLHGFAPGLHAMNRSTDLLLQSQSRSPTQQRGEIFNPLGHYALAFEGAPTSRSHGPRGNAGGDAPRPLSGAERPLPGIPTQSVGTSGVGRGDMLSARSIEGEGNGASPPHESLVPLPKTRFPMGSELKDVAYGEESPVRVVELKGYYLRKTHTTWAEYAEYVGEKAGKHFAIIARNKQTGRMEVLNRGTERGLKDLFKSFKGLEQNKEGTHDGYELARVVKGSFSIPEGQGNHPIIDVTWYEALGFADWWGRRYAGKPGHLPTEAQTENTLRGPMVDITARMREEGLNPETVDSAHFAAWVMGEEVKGQYEQGRFGRYENFVLLPEAGEMLELSATVLTNSGDRVLKVLMAAGHRIGGYRVFPTERGDFNDQAIHSSVITTKKGTRPVDEGALNPSGLIMGGNAWEWGNDWYGDSYQGLAAENPTGPVTGEYRVLRVGSFGSSLYPGDLHAAGRNCDPPGDPLFRIGFRVALSQD